MDLIKKANLRVGEAFKGSTSSTYLTTSNHLINAFKNGIMLCRIVEFVEHMIFKGLHENPKSVAAITHNINKSFEILRLRKVIDFSKKKHLYL